MFLLVYVYDIIVTGNDCFKLEKVIQFLNEKFSLKDLGELAIFLDLKFIVMVNAFMYLNKSTLESC